MKRQYLHSAQKKLSRMDNTWRDNTTFSTEEAIKNGQYMKRQYLHWAQKKLSRMDNTWRDNIYIQHRRSYQEWTIHKRQSTFSTEEAIKNGQYMKRQYLHWAQKKLSRMDNTWRDNIYIQHRRSYQEWTIHEETISTFSTEEAIKNGQYMKRQYLHSAQKKLSRIRQYIKRQYLHSAQKKLSRMDNTWRDNIYIQHRRSYQEWTIHEETILTLNTEEYQEWTIHEVTISTFSTEEAIKNGQYMKRQYLHSAQKKLSRIDNTWRDNIYIQHRRSYQEWTIHEETISTFSTEEAIKNGQYMKRQYLHSAQKKLSRMDNTWRDNIYIQHRRSYQEWTIHEETILTLSTEEAIKNGQYMKRQYLHLAQKKLSRMDNTWRDNIYIQHRRSYQEWKIHEETISTLSTEEAIKNGQYTKRQYLHWAQKKLSRMDNTWRDTIYIQHRRSYQEWTIHEETISTFSTEEAIKNGQYMKRQYLHSAQKKLSRMDNTWRDNIYIEHRRSYQEWTIHEETISTLSTEEAITNGQYMKRQYLHSAQKKLSRMENTRRDNIYIEHRRSYQEFNNTWRDNIYIQHRRSYQEWTIHEETISTFSTEEAIKNGQYMKRQYLHCTEEAIKNGQYMKRQYLHWAQKKLSRMDNTWRDNIYIQHRRSYQEWTIHEETISTFSTEEAIKNGQYMKRQYLHSAQKKLSRMDNTWRDNIYIQHRRSYQEWTIHEETISTFSTEEAIKNGQYMKRQYLHSAQKKLSRMDNTWRDNIYIQHRRSYQEWTIHEETISTFSTEEAIKNGQYMKRQYLHSAQKKLSRMDNTWRDNIYIQHRRSYQEWTIHEETILTLNTEEDQEWTIHEQYMKRQYLHWAQKKLSRWQYMKRQYIQHRRSYHTWRDNIYIQHRRSYQEWTIHEETISTLSTEEAIKNGQYMKRQYLHSAQKKLSRIDNTWRDNIYIQHRRSYQEWTIHEETILTLSTEEAIKNGQYMKRQYLHWAQKKLSRMDNTWRDNIYIQHRRSYQEWTIHEETILTLNTEEAIKNGQYMKWQYLHSAQKKLSRMDNTWRDNIYIEHRRSYQEWTIHEETISTFSTEEAIKNGQYMKRQYLHWAQKKLSRMDNTWRDNIYIEHRRSYQEWTIHKRQYLHWAQKKLSRMDNTWRDNIYIEHRRSYQEWTIHEETISTFSTEEAIKNGQYMKRQYLHSAQKKLSRMDNTWRDNIYIQHRRSYQEWTIHEETISTLSTEEAIKNGQYMKRQYLHSAQKKLSRMDNTWRDNIYIQHRRSYQEWTIHEETISTLSTEEAIKNGQYMKRQYLHSAQKKLSRMDNTWRDNIYIQHRRSYQEWTIHEETISTFSTEEAIKNGQYMKRQYLHSAQKKLSRIRQYIKRQYLHSAQKKLSRMDNTWRDNIYIQHRRSYQEWTIHEETILTLNTEEAIKNGQYMKWQYLHSAQKKLSRMDNTWRDNIYIQHRRSYHE